MNPAFVLVPGAFSNSFGWAPLQRELALRGLRSLTVDLPGRGYGARIPLAYQAPQDAAALASAPSGLAGASLAANVEHVVGLVRRGAAHGPVIADADELTPDNPFDVHSIESSHAGFLVHPGQAADILAGLATG
ncbi:MAG TPA: hypothetical protein VGJ45_38935 [Pseudonocardiaceae bacterium]